MSTADVDDLLGPATPPKKARRSKTVDDLLGPAPRKARKKSAGAKRKYVPLVAPKTPEPKGIFALRESKGRNLGRTCLICKTELKHTRGRPPVICGKKPCFRAYRNAYRADYDKVRAAS